MRRHAPDHGFGHVHTPGEDADHVICDRPALPAASVDGVLEVARAAQEGLHEAGGDLRTLLDELVAIKQQRDFGGGIIGLRRGDVNGGAKAHDLAQIGLDHDGAVDGAALQGGDLGAEIQIGHGHVAEGEIGLLQHLVQGRERRRARRGEGELQPLEIAVALVFAAIDQILADHQRLIAKARRRAGARGDHAHVDLAVGCVVEGRCRGAPAHIQIPGAQKRHHLHGGIDVGEGDVETLVAEIAALPGDEEADVPGRVQYGDIDLVSPLRGKVGEQAHEGRNNEMKGTVTHDVSSRHAFAA